MPIPRLPGCQKTKIVSLPFPLLWGNLRCPIYCSPLPSCQAGRGLCPLSAPDGDTEIQHSGISNRWLLAILPTPDEHRATLWVDPEKEEEPLAAPALPLCFPLPRVLTLAHAFLASASAKPEFTPAHTGNCRLLQITYSLAFHFKITLFFLQVYF